MDIFLKVVLVIAASFTYATPIIFAGMGGLYSEKSGVVNIGLEGLMVIGAFVAALIAYFVPADFNGILMVLIALFAAGVAGMIFSLFHAVASINFRANQIISGTAVNMLALALTVFLVKLLFDGTGETPGASIAYVMDINFGIFQVNWTFFLVMAIVMSTGIILKFTRFGLRLRAVGENPSAVDAAGVSVARLRYTGVLLSGLLAAIGGAITVLTFANGKFSALSISGLGFLGLASLIFGKWKPWGVFFAALFFGFSRNISETALSNFPGLINVIPSVVLKILPYALTIVALIIFSRSATAPKASGQPYDKGAR